MSEEVKKIPGKRWLHVIPPCILIYIFSYMDRTNIGFAMAGGMSAELNMTASISGLAAGIFFIGYLFLQVPGGDLAERGYAKKFIAICILLWSGISIVNGFVESVTQLLVVRFILGFVEGGVWPAVMVIISHWFPQKERGLANSCFIMVLAISSIVTGPISGWLVTMFNWRYLFIIEGCVSLLLIFAWWPLIDENPQSAKWLSKEERDYLVTTLAEEQKSISKDAGHVSFKQVIGNLDMWKLILIYFASTVGLYGFAMWLPTILKNLTSSGMAQIGLLSTLPYFAMMLGLYVFGKLSDKSGNRKKYVVIPYLGIAICFLISNFLRDYTWVSFAFLVAVGFFLQSACGSFWTIPTMLFPSNVAGAGMVLINALGNLGGFFVPFIVGFLTTQFNSIYVGTYFVVVTMIVGALIAMSLPKKTEGKCNN